MYQMTDREIAEITAMLIIGIAVTGLAMAGFDAARAAGLIAERVAAGYRDGIIAAAVIAPVSVIIRHAIVLPRIPRERGLDRSRGRAIDFRYRS